MRTIRELNLCDDFLFHEVMKNEKMVRALLETVLDLKDKIQKIKYIEDEKNFRNGYTGKGIRVDVYVKDDELNVYDIEIQNGKLKVIGKRSRKYQSSMDYEALKRGEDYDKLKKQYIIFICTGDPFGRGLYKYTFINKCTELPDLELGDETVKVFLNTKGTTGDASDEIKEFLKFIENSSVEVAQNSSSEFVKSLSDCVEKVKNDDEIGGVYMTFEEKMIELAEYRAEEMAVEIAEKKAVEIADKKVIEMIKGFKAENVDVAVIAKITGKSIEEIESI